MAANLKIFGDPKGALNALNTVQRKVKETSSQVKGAFSKLGGIFSSIFSPLGFGLGGLGVSTILTTMVNRFDEIGKAAANMGVSAKYFQQIRFAAERTGTSVDQVREAFSKVQMQVGRFMTGDATAGSLMAKLGLTREDLAGLNAEMIDSIAYTAQAWGCYADLCRLTGDSGEEARARELYQRTCQAMNDKMWDEEAGSYCDAYASTGMIAISHIDENIGSLSDEQAKAYKAAINACFWSSYMGAVRNMFSVPEEFYQVSGGESGSEGDYGKYISVQKYVLNWDTFEYEPNPDYKDPDPADWYKLGFVNVVDFTMTEDPDYPYNDGYYYTTPNATEDLSLWTNFIFATSSSEIATMGQTYERIKQKYEILKKALEDAGCDLSLITQ